MTRSFYDVTGNASFVRSVLPMLDREYRFWMANRTVVVSVPLPVLTPGAPGVAADVDTGTLLNHTLNRFHVSISGPRPESYREDATAAGAGPELWSELAAAAESGWDFSSRWLRGGVNLSAIRPATST